MTKFNVPEMSCGHCTSAIEGAVRRLDPRADVSCDLATHTVTIGSGLDDEALVAAIRDAGYEATPARG